MYIKANLIWTSTRELVYFVSHALDFSVNNTIRTAVYRNLYALYTPNNFTFNIIVLLQGVANILFCTIKSDFIRQIFGTAQYLYRGPNLFNLFSTVYPPPLTNYHCELVNEVFPTWGANRRANFVGIKAFLFRFSFFFPPPPAAYGLL